MGVDACGVPQADLRQGESPSRCVAAWRHDLSVRRRSVRRVMGYLGAHLSIAGGLPRAVDRAKASKCEALQIFTKSAGQWRARPLPDEEVAEFRRRVERVGLRAVVAHNSYLINIAAADTILREKSIDALREELDRAERLGLDGLVMHPGSYTTGSVE